MERPRGIAITCLLMCVTNAMGLFLIKRSAPNAHTLIFFNILLVTLGYVALCLYMQNHNWMRWLVMLESLQALWNLQDLLHPSATTTWIAKPMIVSEGFLAAFLLWYLNTRAVRAWFTGRA